MSSTAASQPKKQLETNKYVKDAGKTNVLTLESKIMGMTLMDNGLFVVCKKPQNVIFKFDLDASGGNEAVPVELSISKMTWPRGIAASEKDSYLYIIDWDKIFGGKLWRYRYKRGEETRVKGPVAVLDVQPFGVSVSPKTDEVLVTCATPVDAFHKRGWIYVYKPSGDEFSKVRTIDLPDMEIPRHAILTASSRFFVCHGWTTPQNHGVTSFRDEEKGSFTVAESSIYGRAKGGGNAAREVDRPLSLSCYKNQMILVVDYNNSRIHLVTESFEQHHLLLTKEEHGIEWPRHVSRDPSTGRLYVGQEDGKVHIFEER